MGDFLCIIWKFIQENSILPILIAILGWFAVSKLNNDNAKRERRIILKIQAYSLISEVISDMIAQFREIVSNAHQVKNNNFLDEQGNILPKDLVYKRQNIEIDIIKLRELNNAYQKCIMRSINSFDNVNIDVIAYYTKSQDICNQIATAHANILAQIIIDSNIDISMYLQSMIDICEKAFSMYGNQLEVLSEACYKGLYKTKKIKKQPSKGQVD